MKKISGFENLDAIRFFIGQRVVEIAIMCDFIEKRWFPFVIKSLDVELVVIAIVVEYVGDDDAVFGVVICFGRCWCGDGRGSYLFFEGQRRFLLVRFQFDFLELKPV